MCFLNIFLPELDIHNLYRVEGCQHFLALRHLNIQVYSCMLTVGHFGYESQQVRNDHTKNNRKFCDTLFLVFW